MALETRDINGKPVVVETNKPGKALSGFSLPDTILERAGEVYKEDAENLKIRDEKYQGLPESMRPRLSTQKGTRKAGARAPGLLLNPFNREKHREKLIKDIIEKGGSDLVESYDPKTGTYGLLKESDKLGGGIIDDDITKGLVLKQDKNRKNTTEFKNLTKEQRAAVNTLTRTEDIIKDVVAAKKLKETRERIGKLDQGQTILDDYSRIELNGNAPTQKQLDMLETHVNQLQPKALRDRELHDANVADVEQTTASRVEADTIASGKLQLEKDIETNRHSVAQRTAATAEGTLSLAQTNANNALTQQEFENEDKVAYRNYQAQEAEKLRAFTATENAAQRATQMEINLLGREDSREERAYDRRRDERQDRQMMIMQMMKGLQQLGGSFSI